MRKIFTSLAKGAAMCLTLAATAFAPWQVAGAADLLIDENFEYPAGDLYGQGGWLRWSSQSADPIKVADGSLTFTGYMDQAVGNKVVMGTTASAEDLWKSFADDTMLKEGTVYAAFLLNVSKPNVTASDPVFFFHFFAQKKSPGMVDGANTTEVGKLWMVAGSDENHYKLAVSRHASKDKIVATEAEYEAGKTYLVVISYGIVEGATNDVISLWVDPQTTGGAAPAPLLTNDQSKETSNTEASLNYGGLMGVCLRQAATKSAKAPELALDALRASTDWASLFAGQDPGPVVTDPEVILSAPSARMAPAYAGTPLTATLFVGGKNLTGPVNVTCPEGVTCSKSTIPADEAMAEEPVELVFSLTAPQTAGEYTYTVTLESEGAEPASFSIIGEVLQTVDVPNASRFVQEFENGAYDGVTFRYTGKAVVTAIDSKKVDYGDMEYYIYAQDMTGGLMLNTSWMGVEEISLKVGDEITGTPFMIEGFLGAPQAMALPIDASGAFATVTATGKTKTPAEVKIADVTAATGMEYIYRLLTLQGVRFVNPEGTFTPGVLYDVTDGEHTAKLKVAAGSDLAGQPIPAGTFAVTGVGVNPKGLTLLVTSASSIVEGAPEVSITPEKTFDFATAAAPIDVKTEIFKYTVVAENLPQAVPVTITGQDRVLFEAVPSEIPAGSGTTVVTVYYYPDAPGMHKAGILFDFDAIDPVLNYAAQFGTCKAYDPQHMPEVTIEPAVIELECKAGETVTATATLNAPGTFDYITATRSGTADNGGITIDNTYLLPGSKDVTLTVTFAPKAEGEYTDTWTYTSSMVATPATITVKARCVAPLPPEPQEGDTEIKADMENPSPWYTQDFASLESNKPLSLEGWSNLAEQGTRAWWGYTGESDGQTFTAAKVTAYDSAMKPGQGTPCAMTLVSPALDYKNAPVKKLRFRLMGMFLTDESTDRLTVNLGEAGTDGKLAFYEMEGFDIPAKADQAGEWVEYDVDMSLVPDMPDAFVIAFTFTGTRGADNATTYYITDFEWGGKTDSLECLPADGLQPDADGWYTIYNAQGLCVLRTRDASELRTLPAGLYISRGRKFAVR